MIADTISPVRRGGVDAAEIRAVWQAFFHIQTGMLVTMALTARCAPESTRRTFAANLRAAKTVLPVRSRHAVYRRSVPTLLSPAGSLARKMCGSARGGAGAGRILLPGLRKSLPDRRTSPTAGLRCGRRSDHALYTAMPGCTSCWRSASGSPRHSSCSGPNSIRPLRSRCNSGCPYEPGYADRGRRAGQGSPRTRPHRSRLGTGEIVRARRLPSAHSRRVYARALDEFRAWAAQAAPEGFTKAAVQRYRAHLEALALAPSTINLRLTAVRKLAQEAADNGLLDPELASAIGRVKGTPQKGRRLGNWLSREQASDLLRGCAGNTRKELRDRALLCLLVGCGLRRAEAAALTIEHIQQREGSWGHCRSDRQARPGPFRTDAVLASWREDYPGPE